MPLDRLGFRVVAAVCLPAVLLTGPARDARADEAVLRNGFRLEGKAAPIQALTLRLAQQSAGEISSYPILMVDTGVKRYFVADTLVADIQRAADLSTHETFQLKQFPRGRKLMVQSLGGYTATPFDEYGRRRLTVQVGGEPLHILQGITEINPKYVKVTGVNYVWESALATASIPPKALEKMIRRATDQADPDDRLAVARFYIQAEMYQEAKSELESIRKDFPELQERTSEVELDLRQLQAKRLLAELRRRRDTGQHRLATAVLRRFPTENVSAAVLKEVRDLANEYRQRRDRLTRVRLLLSELQARLEKPEHGRRAAMLRSLVNDELDYESLPRMDAFLKLADDDSLSPEDKLALAYSGWVLGSANAITDFEATLRLWDARFLVLEYLRARHATDRDELLTRLAKLESVGPRTIVKLLPHLPPPVETPGIEPAQAARVEIAGQSDAEDSGYWVVLPAEYSSHRAYPLIVTLRPRERSAKSEAIWWSGTPERPGPAQRRGYIVIAPEYTDEKTDEYDYDVAAHRAVLEAIRDARMRFHVDSDRIYLAGHGMGGTAAFDIGMSHPHLFAGVVPICGFSEKYCKWYWRNCERLPWYVVTGEKYADSLARNAREMNRMMLHNFDVLYAEFKGRGYETYYEEIPRLFDWMSRQRRAAPPREISAVTLRPTDNRFFWLEMDALLPQLASGTALIGAPGRGANPIEIRAKIADGLPDRTTIQVARSGGQTHTLWLSPEIVDFSKRIVVRVKGRRKFSGFLKPDTAAVLEDFRTRGDRQRIYQAKLVGNRREIYQAYVDPEPAATR